MKPVCPVVNNPDVCIVHSAAGGLISAPLAALLDPIDPATLHQYILPPATPVELHGHDYDEYWWFISGSPLVTLWTPAGGSREYQLQPGDLVALVRGMAHTLWADHQLTYHQFSSVRSEGARQGHLTLAELVAEVSAEAPPVLNRRRGSSSAWPGSEGVESNLAEQHLCCQMSRR